MPCHTITKLNSCWCTDRQCGGRIRTFGFLNYLLNWWSWCNFWLESSFPIASCHSVRNDVGSIILYNKQLNVMWLPPESFQLNRSELITFINEECLMMRCVCECVIRSLILMHALPSSYRMCRKYNVFALHQFAPFILELLVWWWMLLPYTREHTGNRKRVTF